MRASDRLTRAGVAFEKSERGAHLIIRHAGRVIDFWPLVGLWIDRARGRRRLGVRGLIKELKNG